ncbi:MAG: hypothetical protein R6V31_09465, partial [Halohasta sp.]
MEADAVVAADVGVIAAEDVVVHAVAEDVGRAHGKLGIVAVRNAVLDQVVPPVAADQSDAPRVQVRRRFSHNAILA